MPRLARRRTRWTQAAAVTATGLLAAGVAGPGAGGTAAGLTAKSPFAPAKVFACYSDKTDALFYVSHAKAKSCPTGESLISWSVQGPQGRAGAQGPVGSRGAQGTPGERGAQGSRGAQGGAGAQGAQGAQGKAGARGPAGSRGASGARGRTGTPGAQGPQGQRGPQGSVGPQGARGSQGAQGPQGNTGGPGAQGAAGPAGAPAFTHTWAVEDTTVQPTSGAYPKSTPEIIASLEPGLPGSESGSYEITATVAGTAFPAFSSVTTLSCEAGLFSLPTSTLISLTPPARAAARYGNFGMVQLIGLMPNLFSSQGVIDVQCNVNNASWRISEVTLTATELHADFGRRHQTHDRGDMRSVVVPRNQFARPARSRQTGHVSH